MCKRCGVDSEGYTSKYWEEYSSHYHSDGTHYSAEQTGEIRGGKEWTCVSCKAVFRKEPWLDHKGT